MKVYYSILYDIYTKTKVACDCPCDDLVDVEPPKMSIMALSYIAQGGLLVGSPGGVLRMQYHSTTAVPDFSAPSERTNVIG